MGVCAVNPDYAGVEKGRRSAALLVYSCFPSSSSARTLIPALAVCGLRFAGLALMNEPICHLFCLIALAQCMKLSIDYCFMSRNGMEGALGRPLCWPGVFCCTSLLINQVISSYVRLAFVSIETSWIATVRNVKMGGILTRHHHPSLASKHNRDMRGRVPHDPEILVPNSLYIRSHRFESLALAFAGSDSGTLIPYSCTQHENGRFDTLDMALGVLSSSLSSGGLSWPVAALFVS